jgi:tyrosyl-tRNA synthetase
MSKSKGNHIGITEPPDDMFGKVMSISDDTMFTWYQLLSDKNAETNDPLAAKKALAHQLVARFHGQAQAEDTLAWWNQGRPPRNVEEASAKAGPLYAVLTQAGLGNSNRDSRQKIEQGGVTVDEGLIKDPTHKISAGTYLITVGKKSVKRVRVEEG